MLLRDVVFADGPVVKGFGRGSKQLGCPTANFPEETVERLPAGLASGVYYGWAKVDDEPVRKMVANLGTCPFYGNERRSFETHLLHLYERDFYGARLRVCAVGYLRPEANYASVRLLKEAIAADVEAARTALDGPDAAPYRRHAFFADDASTQ